MVFEYLEETYMSPTAIFPPNMWADCIDSEVPTTTNGCESFHKHFGDLFGSANTKPDIYRFLENLSDKLVFSEIKFKSRKPVTKMEHRHSDVLKRLRNNEISISELLRCVAKNVQPPSI